MNLLQTWAFGKARVYSSPWSLSRHLIKRRNVVIGAAQAMTRLAPFGLTAFTWINRGPPRVADGASASEIELASMLASVRDFFVGGMVLYLRQFRGLVIPLINKTLETSR